MAKPQRTYQDPTKLDVIELLTSKGLSLVERNGYAGTRYLHVMQGENTLNIYVVRKGFRPDWRDMLRAHGSTWA